MLPHVVVTTLSIVLFGLLVRGAWWLVLKAVRKRPGEDWFTGRVAPGYDISHLGDLGKRMGEKR